MTKYYFVVETMDTMDGKKLKALKPDADGYYKDVPLMVLGVPTLNDFFYNPEPTIKCITDPTSRFNMMLKAGSLYGECDHPPVRTKEDLTRLMEIHKKTESHHFRKVHTATEALANGGVLIMGDLKPSGPYGPYLKESLENPHENTSFSVRSLCQETVNPSTGQRIRDIQILVTFDYVHSGGFKEASKRYSPATESLELNPEDFPICNTAAGMESSIISDTEFVQLFGTKHIRITRSATPIDAKYIPGHKTFIGEDGNRHSLHHALLRR